MAVQQGCVSVLPGGGVAAAPSCSVNKVLLETRVVPGCVVSDRAAGPCAALVLPLLCCRALVVGRGKGLLWERAPAWPAISCGVGGGSYPASQDTRRHNTSHANPSLLPCTWGICQGMSDVLI